MREMLDKHMIRRKISSINQSVSFIPESHDKVVYLDFSKPERALYDYLEKVLANEALQHISKTGSVRFLLYLRLKQICVDHWILLDKFPDLIPMAKTQDDKMLLSSILNPDIEYSKERSYYDTCSEFEGAMDVIKSY